MSTITTEPEAAACERVQARLDELLDGGLGALAAARDEGHLEACARCAAERERRARWLAALRSAALPDARDVARAGAGLAERLALARSPRRPAFTLLAGGGARRSAVAAGLAASALLALALLRGLGAVELPDSAALGRSLRSLGSSALPNVSWPDEPEQLLGGA